MFNYSLIADSLSSFSGISLDEMDNVRLMNRTDIKYLLPVTRVPDILQRMNGNYKVLEINNTRVFSYNTVYLDTVDYLFYSQHVTGKLSRSKVRFRKYEATGDSYLEVKEKTNKNRTVKWRIKNSLTPDGQYDEDARRFIECHVHNKPLALHPVLTNIFSRMTFVGNDANERITMDFNISSTAPNGLNSQLLSIAVLEVKRDRFTDKSLIMSVLKELAITQTGFSKYCIGTATLNDNLRKNTLKPTFLLINKIQNEHNKIILAG